MDVAHEEERFVERLELNGKLFAFLMRHRHVEPSIKKGLEQSLEAWLTKHLAAYPHQPVLAEPQSKRFNGFKQHIATDLETELILACKVTPANRLRG